MCPLATLAPSCIAACFLVRALWTVSLVLFCVPRLLCPCCSPDECGAPCGLCAHPNPTCSECVTCVALVLFLLRVSARPVPHASTVRCLCRLSLVCWQEVPILVMHALTVHCRVVLVVLLAWIHCYWLLHCSPLHSCVVNVGYCLACPILPWHSWVSARPTRHWLPVTDVKPPPPPKKKTQRGWAAAAHVGTVRWTCAGHHTSHNQR